jgi:peptidoglycan hydrolase-like amidase
MTKKTGPPSFEELYGEPFTDFRFKLPQSHHDHLKRRATEERTSIAEYLRALIAADIITRASLEAFKAIPRKAGNPHREGE